MKLTIPHYFCLVVAFATLYPSSAHAVPWTFKSVKSFGATGNGTTDDTVAINQALAADTMIYFPPGTYKYVGQMTLTTNKSYRIYGEARCLNDTFLWFQHRNYRHAHGHSHS